MHGCKIILDSLYFMLVDSSLMYITEVCSYNSVHYRIQYPLALWGVTAMILLGY